MTVRKALLIDIKPNIYGSFLCTFCKKRDKFHLPIPSGFVAGMFTGKHYDVKFDMTTNNINGMVSLSFNYIDLSKDEIHD